MKVVNLWSGPGVGKSTTAAGIFNLMKLEKYDVELVTEYAKKLTWQKRHNTLTDQMYVTAKQNHRMRILDDQVEWCITDSPLMIGLHYQPNFFPDTFRPFVTELFQSYNNVNFFINRVKDYNPKGRNQTYEEAIAADKAIEQILIDMNEPYVTLDGDEDASHKIFDLIKQSEFTYTMKSY